jgi:hypothetical protein
MDPPADTENRVNSHSSCRLANEGSAIHAQAHDAGSAFDGYILRHKSPTGNPLISENVEPTAGQAEAELPTWKSEGTLFFLA